MDMRQNAAQRQRNADYRAEELDDLKRQHEMQEMKENEMVRSMPECPVGSVWVTEPSRSNVSMRVVASGLLPPQGQTLTQPAPSTGFEASLLPPGSGARAVHRDGPPSSPQPQERGRAGLHPSRHTLRLAQSEPQAHFRQAGGLRRPAGHRRTGVLGAGAAGLGTEGPVRVGVAAGRVQGRGGRHAEVSWGFLRSGAGERTLCYPAAHLFRTSHLEQGLAKSSLPSRPVG